MIEHWWANEFAALAKALVLNGATRATKYVTTTFIIRATRKRYGGKLVKRKGAPVEILFTVGRPNYLERAFIKTLKKAGEPFPVRKIQLKFPKES